jgi:hypothetical protein
MGPSGRLIDEKKPDEPIRETIRREIEQALVPHTRNGEVRLSSTVLLVTAAKP